MIIRLVDAIRDALNEIQELGYVVIPAADGEHIEILWPQLNHPPDIQRCVEILQTDAEAVGKVLRQRSVSIPLWLVLGYPWDRPLHQWKRLHHVSHAGSALQLKKAEYAGACIEFYKRKNSLRWKNIHWEEPWPILL